MKEFKGRVAVVTGAASGIGRGLAERFAAEAMHVVLADVEAPALEAAERAMRDAGATVLAVRTDVSQAADVQALADKTVERFGGVHVVCNNAGVAATKLAWEEGLEDWQWVLGVNLWGVIHGVRTFVPIMQRGGEEGHIVNTASVAGLMAGGGASAYTTSKFAVVGLSEVLYYELLMTSGGKLGVSLLCPAATDTRIIDAGRNRPGGALPGPEAGIGLKRVNGFNLHTYAVWLVFNNGNGSQNIFANPLGNSRMFTSASSWNVPDNNGAFGPTILAVESPNGSFLPQDSIAHSTVCMVIAGSCN